MTNTTTANFGADKLRRRSPYWWLWPTSCVIHVAILIFLISSQLISIELGFDRDELAKQAQAAEKRANDREKRDRKTRAQRSLTRDHQKRLQNEIERRSRHIMIEQIQSLKRSRKILQEAKELELEKIVDRTEDDYRRKLIEQIVAIANTTHVLARKRQENTRLFSTQAKIRLTKAAEALPDGGRQLEVVKELVQFIKKNTTHQGRISTLANSALEMLDTTTQQIENAAAQKISDLEKQNNASEETAESIRTAYANLQTQTIRLREDTHMQVRVNPIVSVAQQAVLKAHDLQANIENREIAVDLHNTSIELVSDAQDVMVERLKSSVAFHTSAGELEAKVKQFLDQLPEMEKLNDVSSARRPPDPKTLAPEVSESNLNRASLKKLYETAESLEKEIEQNFTDRSTAQSALKNNTSFNEAAESHRQGESQRNNLGPALEAKRRTTIGEMNELRHAINKAIEQTQSMARNGRYLADQVSDAKDASKAFVGATAAGQGEGQGNASIFDSVEGEGGAHMKKIKHKTRVHFNYGDVQANALPGRRFSKNTPRTGWLYVDTWYLIGPWENHGRIDYTNVHPPESGINFDAVYTDGKLGRTRTTARRPGRMEGILKWQFRQSDTMRIRPFRQAQDATWYAYTELYFEEAKDLLVGSPADDCVRVWINDQLVRDEAGLAQWSFNQAFYPVSFQQGTNRVLVRLENGPGEVQFTFILVPPRK